MVVSSDDLDTYDAVRRRLIFALGRERGVWDYGFAGSECQSQDIA